MVMKVINKYPNDKHVIYLGKTGAKKFSQIMEFMDNQGYNFLKYAYREQRQNTKNVIQGIQSQIRRNESLEGQCKGCSRVGEGSCEGSCF